jgi:hypothetical protein
MTRRVFMVGVVVISSWAVAGCGDSAESSPAVSEPASGSDAEFCESMEHLITLLAPSGPTSPSDTKAGFTEAAGWFDQARRSAPASISDDVATYATAYDDYLAFLEESGFNLDVVFSTTEGRDLAIATSHTLTVPIVDYTTTECGLSFGDES